VCAKAGCASAKAIRKVCSALDGVAEITLVGCQKICEGPVCGVEIDGELTWFEDVTGRETRRSVVDLVCNGGIGDLLRNREIPKRAGKLRA
jgi:hypothetical protein